MRIKSFRNAFLSGLILLTPIAITVYVIKVLIEAIGAPTSKIFFFFAPPEVFDQAALSITLNILSTLLVIVLVTVLGWLSQYFLGRMVVRMAEVLLNNVPFVNRVYGTIKHIIQFGKASRVSKGSSGRIPSQRNPCPWVYDGKREGRSPHSGWERNC